MTTKPPNLAALERKERAGTLTPAEHAQLDVARIFQKHGPAMIEAVRSVIPAAPPTPSVDVEREAREFLAAEVAGAKIKNLIRRGETLGVAIRANETLRAIARALSSRPHPEPELPGEVAAMVDRLRARQLVTLPDTGTFRDEPRLEEQDPPAIQLEAAALLTRLAGDDPDEAYELGKRDGYEKAVQDLDLAAGGDGEYKGVLPSGTVDVPGMFDRIVARLAGDKGERGALEALAAINGGRDLSETNALRDGHSEHLACRAGIDAYDNNETFDSNPFRDGDSPEALRLFQAWNRGWRERRSAVSRRRSS